MISGYLPWDHEYLKDINTALNTDRGSFIQCFESDLLISGSNVRTRPTMRLSFILKLSCLLPILVFVFLFLVSPPVDAVLGKYGQGRLDYKYINLFDSSDSEMGIPMG